MKSGNPPKDFPLPEFPLGAPDRSESERSIERFFLDSVQGNILKGHGRDETRLVFFRFTGTPAQASALLREASAPDAAGQRKWVMSAWNQLKQRDFFQRTWRQRELVKRKRERLTLQEERKLEHDERIAGTQLFVSVMLTRAGLKFLRQEPPDSKSFQLGLKKRMGGVLISGEMLAEPYCWEDTPDDFHGVFLLACDDCTTADTNVLALTKWCADRQATVVGPTEKGTTWREGKSPYGNGYCPPREPFGFADGISSPHFFVDERLKQPMRADRPVAWEWTNLQAENVFITEGAHAGGSFAALLKIEQKVATFRAHEATVAALLQSQLGLAGNVARYVAPAVLMGRTRQGYPLNEVIDQLPSTEAGLRALFPSGPTINLNDPSAPPPSPPPWLNEFDFEPRPYTGTPPPSVSGCPFHMHLRKMNPRTSALRHPDKKTIIRAQPVRRGTTYDPDDVLARAEAAGGTNWPDAGVGLLFFAYMSDLGAQFEQLHTHWAGDAGFPVLDATTKSGRDPVIARPDVPPANNPAAAAPLMFGNVALPKMPEVLKRLGGVYLYVPSIRWLENVS